MTVAQKIERLAMQIRRGIPMALLPWMWSALLLGVAGLGLAWTTSRATPPPPVGFVGYNAERLEALRRRLESSDDVVVFLGDSRLKYVLPDEAEFARELSEALGRPTRVVRIVNNLAVFADFAPLLDSIRALGPELIVVQQDLLIKDRPLLHAVEMRREVLVHRIMARVRPPAAQDQFELQYGLPCWQRRSARNRVAVSEDALQAKLDSVRQVIEVSPQGRSPLRARQFVADQAARGTAVAILELESAPHYEAFVREREPRPAEFLPVDVDRWIAPRRPIEEFCDLTHLSRDGGRYVGSWLMANAAAALRTRAASHNEAAAVAAAKGIL